MAAELVLLRCPECRGQLAAAAGAVRCADCRAIWPLRDGTPVLYREAWVKGPDKVLRLFYDGVPRLHDPAVRFGLPLWQLGGTEEQIRRGYLRRLRLGELPRDRPVRLLEVSVGSGANIARVRQWPGCPAQLDYYGLDLSAGMLRLCRQRLTATGAAPVQLVQGDAHALPFADAAFDCVLHVGGIGGFRDPARALAEMCRVAKAGAQVVVVDEQLDPKRRHGLWPRLWFRALTFYDDRPHCPTEALPPGVTDVVEEQLSRFYYGLSFRAPAA